MDTGGNMLTTEQFSTEVKQQVIGILQKYGVNADSLTTCIAGLAHHIVAEKQGLNWDAERSLFMDKANMGSDLVKTRLAQVAYELKGNEKELTRAVLTIYARYIADKLVDEYMQKIGL
jgi:hypothetical protein